MHKDLSMKAYKVQIVQELKPQDHPMHRFRKSNNQLSVKLVKGKHLKRQSFNY